jgi:1-acyl-sn-glycerol-3-phosphate acyltransferase
MPKLYRQGDEGRLDLQDVRAITRWMPAMGLLKRYFKYTVHGLENLPQDGPALVAMNHGPMPVDAPLLGVAIYEATGRLPRGLTDHTVFKMPVMREMFMAVGAVDGRHDTAEALLGAGNIVIVMPGGAPEAFKPSSKAYQLYWHKRMGFARLAIRAQVPIIPAACIGIDDLYTVPIDMFEAGRKLFRVRSVPLPIAWGRGPLPRRVRLTQYLGAPIHSNLPPEAADDDDAVRGFRDRVIEVMEGLLASGIRARAEPNSAAQESAHE